MNLPASDGSKFGDLLRRHRVGGGLTQEELAERSGLSVRAIADLERGRTARPYRRTVRALAEALNLTGAAQDELFGAARHDVSTPGTPDRSPAPATDPAPSASPVVPRQLPGPVRHFMGRGAETAELTRLLDHSAGPGTGTVVISAIDGTAGVGKTALAVHWAHAVAHRFPDGQLYVNLRGYDPAQPVTAADALASFLRALGVPGPDIPASTDDRAARYRSQLAGRRMLVVLDNAREVDQVRPLLPGTSACVTVVTSRDSLAGLVSLDGAQRLDLDLLSTAEAVRLLRALIGARVDDDPQAAESLAERCCRLPLALRVAAELATTRPAVPLAQLTRELVGQQQLDLLDAAGDARTAIRSVFSWSYRYLDADTARAFRLAALHPGPDFDDYSVAALTGAPLDQARLAVGQLLRAHLIQPAADSRYAMHDLLREYARELAAQDGEQAQRAALTRLFDYYLHAAAANVDVCFPAGPSARPSVAGPNPPVVPPADAAAAWAWLDAHRLVLVAVGVHASGHGWPEYAIQLTLILRPFLDTGAYYSEAVTVYTCGRESAVRVGDPMAEGMALVGLGAAHWPQGEHEQAIAYYADALALFRVAGNRRGEAQALHGLGIAALMLGRYEQGAQYNREALAAYRDVHDPSGRMRVLHNLALVDLQQGRYAQAADYLKEVLAVCQEAGDRVTGTHALATLGTVELRRGEFRQAAVYLQQALDDSRELGNHRFSYALSVLGMVRLAEGDHEQSFRLLQQALDQSRATSDRVVETHTLNCLGEAWLSADRPAQALAAHAEALILAEETGNSYEQARAHRGRARAHQAAGDDLAEIRRQQHAALAIYADLGAPEADEIRAEMAAVRPADAS